MVVWYIFRHFPPAGGGVRYQEHAGVTSRLHRKNSWTASELWVSTLNGAVLMYSREGQGRISGYTKHVTPSGMKHVNGGKQECPTPRSPPLPMKFLSRNKIALIEVVLVLGIHIVASC